MFFKKKSPVYNNRSTLLENALLLYNDKAISDRVNLIKDTIIKGINFEGCSIRKDREKEYICILLKLPDDNSIIICHIKIFNFEDKVMIRLSNQLCAGDRFFSIYSSAIYKSYRWRTLTIEQFNQGITIN